jgi:hypothetical protein
MRVAVFWGGVTLCAATACSSPGSLSGADSGQTADVSTPPDAGHDAHERPDTGSHPHPDSGHDASHDSGHDGSLHEGDAGGLVFIGGSLGTVGASSATGTSGLRVVSGGLEYGKQACNGGLCVNGGIIP